MAAQPNTVQRLLDHPAFYAVGMVVGLIGWAFRYLEDGHLMIVLGAGLLGLVRAVRNRRGSASQ